MRRGDVWYADLEPVRGSESNKVRPVLIVTNNGANLRARDLGCGVVTVVPLTSNVERVYPFQVLMLAEETGLPCDSKAQAEQVRALDVSRLKSFVKHVSDDLMTQVNNVLRIHLDL